MSATLIKMNTRAIRQDVAFMIEITMMAAYLVVSTIVHFALASKQLQGQHDSKIVTIISLSVAAALGGPGRL